MNDDELKKWQAKTRRRLEAEMAAAEANRRAAAKRNPNRAEHQLFVKHLIEIRLERHLTQQQLAKRVGIGQPALARIESGKGNPGLNTLLAIAKALNVNLMLE